MSKTRGQMQRWLVALLFVAVFVPFSVIYEQDGDLPRYDWWCDGKMGDDDRWQFWAEGSLAPGEEFRKTEPREVCWPKIFIARYTWQGHGKVPEGIEGGIIDPLGVYHPMLPVGVRGQDKVLQMTVCFEPLLNIPHESPYFGYYTWVIKNNGQNIANDLVFRGWIIEDEYWLGCDVLGWPQ